MDPGQKQNMLHDMSALLPCCNWLQPQHSKEHEGQLLFDPDHYMAIKGPDSLWQSWLPVFVKGTKSCGGGDSFGASCAITGWNFAPLGAMFRTERKCRMLPFLA